MIPKTFWATKFMLWGGGEGAERRPYGRGNTRSFYFKAGYHVSLLTNKVRSTLVLNLDKLRSVVLTNDWEFEFFYVLY